MVFVMKKMATSPFFIRCAAVRDEYLTFHGQLQQRVEFLYTRHLNALLIG
jgi:hypothetical protein